MNDKLKNDLCEHLQQIHERDLVDLHHQYCEAMNYGDDEIYDIETFFNEFFCGVKDLYSDVICRINYGNFRDNDDWAKFDHNGNIISTSRVEDWIDIDEMVDYIIENDDDLSDTDIRDILEEYEDADDDEDDGDEEDDE